MESYHEGKKKKKKTLQITIKPDLKMPKHIIEH